MRTDLPAGNRLSTDTAARCGNRTLRISRSHDPHDHKSRDPGTTRHAALHENRARASIHPPTTASRRSGVRRWRQRWQCTRGDPGGGGPGIPARCGLRCAPPTGRAGSAGALGGSPNALRSHGYGSHVVPEPYRVASVLHGSSGCGVEIGRWSGDLLVEGGDLGGAEGVVPGLDVGDAGGGVVGC
jgi:hypothetical protein